MNPRIAEEQFARDRLDPFAGTPEEFTSLIRNHVDRFGKIVKTRNIKLER